MPKVSVILPTYNRDQYLGEAVKSVLCQSSQDFEIIVVDDGSTDDTRTVVAQFADRVRYVWQPNQGRCKARNVGIDLAMGQYIVFLDSDDVILPRKLEIQSQFLDEHPSVGVVFSDVWFCDSEGQDVGLLSQSQSGRQFTGDVRGELIQGNFVTIHAAMTRRSCVVEAGGFDEALPSQEDWDLWIRIAQNHGFHYIDEPVARYRIHDEMTFRDSGRIIQGDVAVRKKIMAYPFFSALPRDGRMFCAIGDVRQGRRFFFRALALDPSHVKSYALLSLSLLGPRFYRDAVFLKRSQLDRSSVLEGHW